MAQAPKKKKRRLPKDITERSDREVLERLLGKRVIGAADRITGRSQSKENE